MVRELMLTMTAMVLALSVATLYGARRETDGAQEKIDKIFAGHVENGTPGIAVLVKKNGLVVFQREYGARELRTRTRINAKTNFRLASCTKQFTAMSVMLLVHDGKLRYEESLTDVFPDFPDYGRHITIRNLLNHTSGLPDYEELMDLASNGKTPMWTVARQIREDEVLTLLKRQKNGKFWPGTQWSYSNSGYVVLGLVVSKTSGEPFEDFLHERIFKPLAMNSTLAYVKGKTEVSERSYGHSKTAGIYTETDQSATSATLGDGGVYSNLEDLAKWDEALTRHTLLGADEMQPALIPAKLADGSQPHWAGGPGDSDPQAGNLVSYGFGWFLDPFEGHTRMWHYGDTIGFRTAIQRFADDDLTIILLANCSDVDVKALSSKVADVYLKAGAP